MNYKLLAIGFLLWLASSFVAAVVVAPYLAPIFGGLFGSVPFIGSYIVGSLIGFPVFLLSLWAAKKQGYDSAPHL